MIKNKYVISNNSENLKKANPDVTIEAEYGDICVNGKELTLAHHGNRSNNPAPCISWDAPILENKLVGLSHFDLDTLGGIMLIEGFSLNKDGAKHDWDEEVKAFWNLAAFVDVNGPHKIKEANAAEAQIDQLYAFWAWSEQNKCFAPRDGSVMDISSFIENATTAMLGIYSKDEELMADGVTFAKEANLLNEKSFEEIKNGLIVRSANSFCNHIYVTPNDEVGIAVLSYNPEKATATLSFADDGKYNACEIMQKHLGEKAGGHKGIAGSDRDKPMCRHSFDVLKNNIIKEL